MFISEALKSPRSKHQLADFLFPNGTLAQPQTPAIDYINSFIEQILPECQIQAQPHRELSRPPSVVLTLGESR